MSGTMKDNLLDDNSQYVDRQSNAELVRITSYDLLQGHPPSNPGPRTIFS